VKAKKHLPVVVPRKEDSEADVDSKQSALEEERARRLAEAGMWLRHNGDQEGARRVLAQADGRPAPLTGSHPISTLSAGASDDVATARTVTEMPAVLPPLPRPSIWKRVAVGGLASFVVLIFAFLLRDKPEPPAVAPARVAVAPRKAVVTPPPRSVPAIEPVMPAHRLEPADEGLSPLVESPKETKAAESKTAPVRWTVESTPPGARVVREDTNGSLGRTPLVVSLASGKGEVSLRLELDGYELARRVAKTTAGGKLRVELARQTAAAPAAEEQVAAAAPPSTETAPAPEPEPEPTEATAQRAPPAPPTPAAAPAVSGGPLECPTGANLVRGSSVVLELWCVSEGGVRNGPYVRFYSGNRKAEEGEYRNGKKHGRWVEYYESGAERERTEWRKGVKSW